MSSWIMNSSTASEIQNEDNPLNFDHGKLLQTKTDRLKHPKHNITHRTKLTKQTSPNATDRDGLDTKNSTLHGKCGRASNWALTSVSDDLDPFASLPTKLSKFDEHLITFYLQHYPPLTYGLSTKLQPHPVATNFTIALHTPACFEVILARAALYRLSSAAAEDDNRQALDHSHVTHKGNAIRIIREAVELGHGSPKPRKALHVQNIENLIASIISLGTLDKRIGNHATAATHFQAVRTLIRYQGGPMSIQNMALSRVMCHFECIYGSKDFSYVWDQEHDLKPLLEDINLFFKQLYICQSSLHGITSSRVPTHTHPEPLPLRISPDLFKGVCRPLPKLEHDSEPTTLTKTALSFQLTCLLILSLIVLDSSVTGIVNDETVAQPRSERVRRHSKSSKYDLEALRERLNDPELEELPLNNHTWILQTFDMGTAHSVKIWRAAGLGWLLKHTPFGIQRDVAQWLCQFLRLISSEREASQQRPGANSTESNPESKLKMGTADTSSSTDRSTTTFKLFKLEPFHFSYAA